MTMPTDDIAITDFAALDGVFRIIREGLSGLVDGDHFFDFLAEDVLFEFVISVPGYPRGSRDATRSPTSTAAEATAVHRDPGTSVVVLEYHFVSVITVQDRRVTHWRDYLGPVAVFRATGWPAEDLGQTVPRSISTG